MDRIINFGFINEEFELPGKSYEWFKEEFKKLTTIQLSLYKEKQMKRRINTLILRKNLNDFESFLNLLQSNEKELSDFVDYITINVTEFFRTPDHWNYVGTEIFSKLNVTGEQKYRVWCCACSSGEEPYSVAMLLSKFIPLQNIEVIASDIDERILSKAVKGSYDEKTITTLPEEYLNTFFTKENAVWKISDEIKNCVTFKKLDLLKDEYPAECDMILCRNILIYFTEEAKDTIYKTFRNSLKKNGYLFTGDTEQIVYHKLYGFKKITKYLYQPEDK